MGVIQRSGCAEDSRVSRNPQEAAQDQIGDPHAGRGRQLGVQPTPDFIVVLCILAVGRRRLSPPLSRAPSVTMRDSSTISPKHRFRSPEAAFAFRKSESWMLKVVLTHQNIHGHIMRRSSGLRSRTEEVVAAQEMRLARRGEIAQVLVVTMRSPPSRK